MTSEVRVPAEGRGRMDTQMESEKEVPLIVAGDHAEEGRTTISNQSAISIMGNVKHNLEEAKNMEELKFFFRHFKAEVER